MKPMMALSITLLLPVAMKPPRLMVSRIGSWHRVPILASWGNQSREGGAVIGDHFLPGEEAGCVLAVDRRDQFRQEMVQHLAAYHDLGPRRADLDGGDDLPCNVRCLPGRVGVQHGDAQLAAATALADDDSPAARCQHK
jgi:hypothetical protein